MAKQKTVFTCQNCGAQRPRWEGRCTDCGSWNSFAEETIQATSGSSGRGWALGGTAPKGETALLRLDQEAEAITNERWNTGIGELNRVLGGGLVRGSFILLGGAPGVGKSTLLLQVAHGLAMNKLDVLYISSEESIHQTASRAHRLGVKTPHIEIGSESNLQTLLDLARKRRPKVLIVDSIQTVFLPDVQSAPGTVSQVRECAGHLMSLAKNDGISVLLIGHVTKDGSLAGPKTLEHMVDCVLSFEGDMSYQFRLLRSLKNRYGPTNELGVFAMDGEGLKEVTNPSELFLGTRDEDTIGSAIFASIEGTRPLLCEVQALTVSTPMPMPRRTSVGVDINRIHLLAAVLERHLDLQMSSSDLFINVVGGLKINEPAADLAVVASLLSAESRQALSPYSCFFGEIGLTGEVRAVSFPDLRIKEAAKLGFRKFYVPSQNEKHLKDLDLSSGNTKHEIVYLKSLRDLSRLLFTDRPPKTKRESK